MAWIHMIPEEEAEGKLKEAYHGNRFICNEFPRINTKYLQNSRKFVFIRCKKGVCNCLPLFVSWMANRKWGGYNQQKGIES